MKYILPILLLLLCIGCKHEPKIEIYLLKNRVESYEGVPILEVEEFKDRRENILADGLQDSRWDTIEDEFIFAGKFNASIDDLQDEAFIKDEEIISLDIKQDFFKVDSVAANRISNIKPYFRKGTQFVITVDKKPVLTGYFWNRFSSYWCNTFHLYYINPSQLSGFPNSKFAINNSFKLAYGPIQHTKMENKPPYPPELIEAFRSSGRLIE